MSIFQGECTVSVGDRKQSPESNSIGSGIFPNPLRYSSLLPRNTFFLKDINKVTCGFFGTHKTTRILGKLVNNKLFDLSVALVPNIIIFDSLIPLALLCLGKDFFSQLLFNSIKIGFINFYSLASLYFFNFFLISEFQTLDITELFCVTDGLHGFDQMISCPSSVISI